MLYKTYYNSPIGKLLLVSDGEKLIALCVENQKYYFDETKSDIALDDNLKVFEKTRKWLDRYFNKKAPNITEIPLAPQGGEFRQLVWKILCEIPYGKTITYGEIAKKVAKQLNKEKMSAQAVGNAVGHNPISIIIPCHRVVGTNGSLTGYAGGIDKKIMLLELEGVDMKTLFVPKKGTAI